MYIVSVTVCKMGVFGEELAYRSKTQVRPGDLVTVFFRKQTETAIVLSCQTLSEARAMIRTARFAVQDIKAVIKEQFFDSRFIDACALLAPLYQVSAAKILSTATSISYVRSAVKNTTDYLPSQPYSRGYSTELKSLVYPMRITQYAEYIDGLVAKNTPTSIVIVAPTNALSERIAQDLQSGVAESSVVIIATTRPATKKTAALAAEARIKVYCTTPHGMTSAFAFTPDTIICEFENHPLYHAPTAPYVDYRLLCDCVARVFNVPLVYADFPLSTQAYTSYGSNRTDFAPLLPAQVSEAELEFHAYARNGIVEIAKVGTREVNTQLGEYKLFGKKVMQVLSDLVEKKQTAFIVASRHGYAPSMVCKDCGAIMRCDIGKGGCGGMLVLKNVFSTKSESARSCVCNDCKTSYPPFDTCSNCGGYTLLSLGLGIERITEAVLALVPPEIVYVRNEKNLSLKNVADGSAYPDNTTAVSSAVCIGTIFDLDAITGKFDHVIVVSHEGMLAAPVTNIFDYGEHVARIVRMHANSQVHIQTSDERSDIRLYTGHDYAKRACDYIMTAYQLGISPVPVLALAVSGLADAQANVKKTLSGAAEKNSLNVQAIFSYNYLTAKKSLVPVMTYTVGGFRDQHTLMEYLLAAAADLERIPYVRIAYIPYPAQNRYRLGGWA